MKIIFIAGAYIGDGKSETIEHNIREAEKYAIALANERIGFFCPHKHTEHFSSEGKATAPEEFYYDLDFHFLTHIADAVLVVPGWENSNGTKRELAWVNEKGMKIFYPKDPTDIEDVVNWAKE
ncbi:MAG: DUF1937 family protein [Candidatus Pacebacteria bacterium]|nr:DUF1937 family protein [Candidatus Paceibacterota bacterium]